jgi:uncharacterized protein
VDDLWNQASDVFASRLTYVETHAALAARARASVRARPTLHRSRRIVEERWSEVLVVELDVHVAETAALAARQHRLRGAEAIHLASAAVLGTPTVMVSRDEALRRASLAVGLNIAP